MVDSSYGFSQTTIERVRREWRDRFGREPDDKELLDELESEEHGEKIASRARQRQHAVDRSAEDRARAVVRRVNAPRPRRAW